LPNIVFVLFQHWKCSLHIDRYCSILIVRQPCPWDITLDRVLETEIELEEKPKLDHSFVSMVDMPLLVNIHVNKASMENCRVLTERQQTKTRRRRRQKMITDINEVKDMETSEGSHVTNTDEHELPLEMNSYH
jgi:hypothetical protein